MPLSIYVIADLDTEDGLSALRAALLFSVSQGNFLSRYSSDLVPYKEFRFCAITLDISSQSDITNEGPRTAHSRVFFVFTPHI